MPPKQQLTPQQQQQMMMQYHMHMQQLAQAHREGKPLSPQQQQQLMQYVQHMQQQQAAQAQARGGMPPQQQQGGPGGPQGGPGMPPGGSPTQKMTPQQQAMMQQQMYMQQQQRFAAQNRGTGPTFKGTNRNAGVITDEEWEQAVEKHEDSGRGFRRWFWVLMILFMALLAYSKYDLEAGLDLPPELQKLAERDAQLRGDKGEQMPDKKSTDTGAAKEDAAAADGTAAKKEQTPTEAAAGVTPEEMAEYYKLLDVEPGSLEALSAEEIRAKAEEHLKEAGVEEGEASEDTLRRAMQEQEQQERLDRWRKKQKMKENFNRHLEERGQLVACGAQCEAQHQQMQLAYDTLNSAVDRELFGVLLDENVAKTGRAAVDADELREAYEKKKKEIEESKGADEEVKNMELAEIKDAFDILQAPETRAYYRLTGRKPPEHMKKTSTTHGGWGQELLLRTHKNRLILSWLDHFDAAWADYTVLGVIGFFGFVIPIAVQLPRIIEMAQEIEDRQIQMEELEKQRNAEAAGEAAPAAAAAAGGDDKKKE